MTGMTRENPGGRMKPILTDRERMHLDRRVADVEEKTGTQIVLAAVQRSDTYAELPWKAFALGVSLAALGVVALQMLQPVSRSYLTVLFAVVFSLAAGAICTLLTIAAPRFARFFLDAHRAEVEVNQYAQSLFLSRELFATRRRTGILLLVSMFERQVVLLPDSGAAGLLSGEAMRSIVDGMKGDLAAGRVGSALERGLQGLQGSLPVSAGKPPEDELPNTVIQEKDQ